MPIARQIALLALLAGLTGCESLFSPDAKKAPEPLTALPRQLSVAEQQIIGGSNHFAFGLLRGVVARDDTASNVFLSPLSASMALGMAMNGATGETQAGMRRALGFGEMPMEQVNASYRSLIDLLLGLDSSVDMRLANSIWAREGFPFYDAFYETARTYFDAQVQALDFDDPGTPGVINDWVSKSTEGKIKDIVETIDPDVVMYLINAVYFKGSWTQRFDRSETQAAPFRRADGTQQTVQMMHQEGMELRHLQNAEVEIVDLPYGRGAFTMTVVLPAPTRSLDELIAGLDDQKWSSWMEQMRERELDVFLPRFRLEYEQVLNETLGALGMEQAFDSRRADFTAMSPLGDDLYISKVKQKTFVDVNEEGTEAAGVTSVEVRVVSLPPHVMVNRPFLVAIRERFSGTILFVGKIGAPPSN